MVYTTHFARITPIVGERLRMVRVAVWGLEAAAPIVEALAACGIGRWIWAPTIAGDTLARRLNARHGAALGLDVQALEHGLLQADLILAVGYPALLRSAALAARAADCPALLITPPLAGLPCRATILLPGDPDWDNQNFEPAISPIALPFAGDWEWICAAPLIAGLARALLLRGTAFGRPDLERLWGQGIRALTLGGEHPFDVSWSAEPTPPRPQTQRFHTPAARRGTLLIAGLGSIGSVAAALLARYAAVMALADPDHVEVTNPARQHYTPADLGRRKADALRESLQSDCPEIVAIPTALTNERQVAELIMRHRITAALVATGTGADFPIARALRDHNLPHIVARCYPRARYWEAALVDGDHGPALDDIRGHLHIGPAPAPTPEQIAAYSDAGALEAEPATLVESGWAAAWAARLTHQLLTPPGLRERWLLELLAGTRTCLVGGVMSESTPDGPAYGIARPGQINAWAPSQIGRADAV